MERWLVLAVTVSTSLCAGGATGCSWGSSTLQAGLANAPGLGGPAHVDDRVADVVSNGRDSCGRQGGDGPLRGRIPPCETERPPAATSDLAPRWVHGGARSLVMPWVQHFYTGWPCRSGAGAEPTAVAWVVPTADGASCEPR